MALLLCQQNQLRLQLHLVLMCQVQEFRVCGRHVRSLLLCRYQKWRHKMFAQLHFQMRLLVANLNHLNNKINSYLLHNKLCLYLLFQRLVVRLTCLIELRCLQLPNVCHCKCRVGYRLCCNKPDLPMALLALWLDFELLHFVIRFCLSQY